MPSSRCLSQMSPANGGSGGAIVNVSSGSALLGAPLVYAMSKGALNSMSTGIRDELVAQGVRINSISPGMTNTDMVTKEMAAAVVPTIPMKRLGTPEEIANSVVWLLSDEASYVCGAHIRVAGGRMMGGLQ
jgi:NAD(P)-dependent dehydrogenase (short-subunit alcohol dehydrogenase family)